MKILLERSFGNRVEVKEVKVGFSWTVLFFGFIPPLIRQDWLWAVIIFIVGWLTGGFSTLVFPFFYNKIYINNLLKEGFSPSSETEANLLRNKGFYV